MEDLRQQLRNAKTESIEARLSLSNLCDEESFFYVMNLKNLLMYHVEQPFPMENHSLQK